MVQGLSALPFCVMPPPRFLPDRPFETPYRISQFVSAFFSLG